MKTTKQTGNSQPCVTLICWWLAATRKSKEAPTKREVFAAQTLPFASFSPLPPSICPSYSQPSLSPFSSSWWERLPIAAQTTQPTERAVIAEFTGPRSVDLALSMLFVSKVRWSARRDLKMFAETFASKMALRQMSTFPNSSRCSTTLTMASIGRKISRILERPKEHTWQ